MNILKQQIVNENSLQLRPVKRGSMMSELYPEGTLVADPSGKGPTNFGSVAYRRPTIAEIETGTDPDVYVVSTVYDYMPIIPDAPPSGEGLILAGDFASTLGQGLSDVIGGAGKTLSSFWSSLTPGSKTALAVGGTTLVAFPFLKAYLKSRPIVIGGRGMDSSGATIEEGVPATMITRVDSPMRSLSGVASRPGTETAFATGSVESPDGSTVLDVPVGFWKTALALGKQYDARADILPWDSMGTAMAGDPLSPALLRVPTIYVTDEGKLIRSTAPYAAVVLSGGWKSFVSKVKKAVPKMLGSKVVKGIASFIPGGSAALSVAKAILPKGKPHAEKSAPVQVAEAAGLPVAPSAYVSTPYQAAGAQASYAVTSPMDVVQGESLADALPPAWQGASTMPPADELSEEAQLLSEMQQGQMPLEGNPLAAAAAAGPAVGTALKGATSWIASYAAYTAAPWVFSKVSKLWKRNPVATPSPISPKPKLPGITSPWVSSYAVPPLLPNQGAISSGFVKSLTAFGAMLKRAPTAMQKGMKALPSVYQGTVASMKIGALLVGVGLVANMWWTGRSDRRALAQAVSKVLPLELREKWDALMAKTGMSVAPNLSPDEAQDMIALLMVAITLSVDAEERGVAVEEHKLILDAGREAFDQIQKVSPDNAEKAAKLAASYIEEFPGEYAGSPADAQESMVDLLGDGYSSDGEAGSTGLPSTGGATAAAAGAGTALALAPEDSIISPANPPGTDLDEMSVLERLLGEHASKDPEAEVKIVDAMSTSADENQLAAKLAGFGLSAALIAVLVRLYVKRREAEATGDVQTLEAQASQFWNSLGAVFKNKVQRIKTIKDGSYG